MFNKGDKVKVSGCTGYKDKYNGKTGEYLENRFPNDIYRHAICFDGTGICCGCLFADSELAKVPQLEKVLFYDDSYSYEFADGKLKAPSTYVSAGQDKDIYEITAEGIVLPGRNGKNNDTVIRNTVNGRVFFVHRRLLREYTEPKPKFTKDSICECDDEYCRIVKVNTDGTYLITMQPSIYEAGTADIVVEESELLEVPQ